MSVWYPRDLKVVTITSCTQTNRQTETDRQTERQTDRQTESLNYYGEMKLDREGRREGGKEGGREGGREGGEEEREGREGRRNLLFWSDSCKHFDVRKKRRKPFPQKVRDSLGN